MSQFREGAAHDEAVVARHIGVSVEAVQGMGRRRVERYLARLADVKPDGASMSARREGQVDEGVQREREYLAMLHLSGAPVKVREAALTDRALRLQRSAD